MRGTIRIALRGKRLRLALAGTALVASGGVVSGQAAGAPASPAQAQAPARPDPAQVPAQAPAPTAPVAPLNAGGTIKGTVKAGNVPLPGVSVTATNTLTGRKYATTTDVDGAYAMTIPRTGRYVVKAELAAFAPATNEVRITAEATEQTAAFTLGLASRVAATQAAGDRTAAAVGAALRNSGGAQALNLANLGGDAAQTDATLGGGNSGAALPSLGSLNAGGDAAATTNDSYAVSGVQGSTNALGNLNEDQIRERIEDAVRQNGGNPADMSGVVSLIGGLMGAPGGGPGGGGPGGRRGSGGGGGGAFRNFNPAQPHGSVFYQGGNSALNSAPWQPSLVPEVNPSAYSNRFGVSLAGSPYLPGLTKPDTRQFVFINFTGQKNLNAFAPTPVRVPTALERAGNFSQSYQEVNGVLTPVTIYDPKTGLPVPGNNLANASVPFAPQAAALLAMPGFYPTCNVNCNSTDPTVYNYQTISNAGQNNVALNTRYMRQLGQQTAGGPFGRGGGGGQGGGGRGQRGNQNAPPVLRQNINVQYNYSHAASDIRNIFLPLGGATESDGNSLNLGYVVSYGRLSNNASVNWNRSLAETRNYFTDTANDPTAAANIGVPNQSSGFADPKFYNGVPTIGVTNFAGINNTTPSKTVNQTISFSDFVAWRHKRHNFRFGGDIRRVHADSIGGNNPLGSFQFSGYATESPTDQVATATGTADQVATGAGFADFLLGLPTQTSLQAGLNKIYLRENIDDAYAQDDWRLLPNVTLNYGLRYEYFAPYTEKNNRLVNLDHNADFTVVDPVLPGAAGQFEGKFPTSLVNPDRTMFAPRFGGAWSPKFKYTRNTVVRGGYGINYNTGQFATFAHSLSFQPPFAATQTNAATTVASSTGCTTTSVSTNTTANMTLANGFGCSTTAIQNNYSVNKNYRLGMVQVYNLNIQRTLPQQIVLNIGYNGAKGSDLDIVRAPNHTATTVTTANAEAFRYEDSIAGSHSNQLLVSVQQRQHKGIALGLTYTYSHSIDNASSIGGASATTAQNDKRLDLEEGNSAFDQRHLLVGTYLFELPFGPNRAFLNKGGFAAHVLDGFSLNGSLNIGSGLYFTPQYASSAAQELAGGTYTLRPDRVFTQPIAGAGRLRNFFNTAAFVKPANGFGTASRDSIEGPGTLTTNISLSRTVQLGDTRSFEARVTATNAFNTVQYNGINTTVNSAEYGQVTGAAQMRQLQVQARYRF